MKLNLSPEYVESIKADSDQINQHSGKRYSVISVYKALDLDHSPKGIAQRLIANMECGLAYHTPSKCFAIFAVGPNGPDWHKLDEKFVKRLIRFELDNLMGDIDIHRQAIAAGITTDETQAEYAIRVTRFLGSIYPRFIDSVVAALQAQGTQTAPRGRVSRASQLIYDATRPKAALSRKSDRRHLSLHSVWMAQQDRR